MSDNEEIQNVIIEEPEPLPIQKETIEEEPKAKLRVKKPRTQAQKDALAKGRAKLQEKRESNKQMKTVEKKKVNRKKLVEKYDMDEYINEQVEKKLKEKQKVISKQPKDIMKNIESVIENKPEPKPQENPKDLFFSRFFPK